MPKTKLPLPQGKFRHVAENFVATAEFLTNWSEFAIVGMAFALVSDLGRMEKESEVSKLKLGAIVKGQISVAWLEEAGKSALPSINLYRLLLQLDSCRKYGVIRSTDSEGMHLPCFSFTLHKAHEDFIALCEENCRRHNATPAPA